MQKPSVIAAASLILAINLSNSSVTESIGLKKFEEHALSDKTARTKFHTAQLSPSKAPLSSRNDPLRLWDSSIGSLTNLSSDRDVQPVYITLLNSLNNSQFNGVLSEDPALFIN